MPNNLVPDDRIPVIVGVGEIVDRPKEILEGLEPLALLEQALKRAEADSGSKLLGGAAYDVRRDAIASMTNCASFWSSSIEGD